MTIARERRAQEGDGCAAFPVAAPTRGLHRSGRQLQSGRPDQTPCSTVLLSQALFRFHNSIPPAISFNLNFGKHIDVPEEGARFNPFPAESNAIGHTSAIDADPTKSRTAVGERPHLDGSAVPEGVHVRQLYFAPCSATFRPKSCMNQDNNSASLGYELLRFAAAFSPSCSRLGQIAGHFRPAIVGASVGKFGRLGPFDVGIEGLHGSWDVAAIECRVCFAEDTDCVFFFFRRH
jgi:hypothetical protein